MWVDAEPDGVRADDAPEAEALPGALTEVFALPVLACGFIAAAALPAATVCGGASAVGAGFADAAEAAPRGVLATALVAGRTAAVAACTDVGLLRALTVRFAAATWRALACAAAL